MSSRTIDADLQASAESSIFNYVIFVSLAFPSGTVRVHNSVGTITWGGNDWLGVGAFGSIDAIEESIELVDNPIRLTLSSITQEIIDAVKTDDVYGRDADIYLGALNADGELEGTPTNWISGYMETKSLSIGQENAVMIQMQTRAAKLKQRNNKRFTIEDHQQDYSGDLFFEYLNYVVDAKVVWGGEQVRTGQQGDSITGRNASGGGGGRGGRGNTRRHRR